MTLRDQAEREEAKREEAKREEAKREEAEHEEADFDEYDYYIDGIPVVLMAHQPEFQAFRNFQVAERARREAARAEADALRAEIAALNIAAIRARIAALERARDEVDARYVARVAEINAMYARNE
jgi:hypothetical protein